MVGDSTARELLNQVMEVKDSGVLLHEGIREGTRNGVAALWVCEEWNEGPFVRSGARIARVINNPGEGDAETRVGFCATGSQAVGTLLRYLRGS